MTLPASEKQVVLDVHPPHEAIHGWRDFTLHLLTITIGLLIALSLEGCVEWQHHRHLVHEAEQSLQAEIKANAAGLEDTVSDIHKQQGVLKSDVAVLNEIIKNGKAPENSSIDIDFQMRGFADVSWRTAQSTGALAYMPYSIARDYSEIYDTHNELTEAEHLAEQDAILSLAPFQNESVSNKGPTPEEAKTIIDRVEVLRGQLLLLDSLTKALDNDYKKFLSTHPQRS